jgi:hypothetical protein
MSKTRDIALLAAGAAFAPRRTEHHHHRAEVVEKRAPTDESVKLLREMEDAVREKMLASLPIKGNAFEGHVVVEHSIFQAEIAAVAVFSLNGRRLEARASVSEFDGNVRLALLDKLHQAIAEKVATEILLDGVRGLDLRI